MAKLDIDFVLMDESVVQNGFRSLMSGARLEDFKRNPVMLFMHNRPMMGDFANSSDPLLTIGKWYDIRVEGDKLLAKPDFDDNDEFAKKIESKVKGGYYNAASIWVDPISVSDDTELMLAGQMGPTLTEWGLFEASIVDIPNCRNAIAIRDEAGELMQLTGNNSATRDRAINYLKTFLKTENKTEMDNKILNTKLGLNADAAEKETIASIDALLALREDKSKLANENAALKLQIESLGKAAKDEKIKQLVTGAVNAKKILQGDVEKYTKLANADFDTTKALLDGLTPAQSVKDQLAANAKSAPGNDDLAGKSWDEIDKENKLAKLKENAELYAVKFKEKFGVEPQ